MKLLTAETLAQIDQLPEDLREKVRALVADALDRQRASIAGELGFMPGVDVTESDFGEWLDTDAAFGQTLRD